MDDRDIQDLQDRVKKLEDREARLVDLVNSLERTMDRISVVLEHYQEQKVEERLRQVELDMSNEQLVTKAVQWLGVSIGGTAILLLASYLIGNIPK